MRGGSALEALVACLRGTPPENPDWMAVIALANRTLLTPALHDALRRAGRLDALPEEGRAYLAFLHGRNLKRNLRLRAQLREALAALNQQGIEPTLLKGAIRLFRDAEDSLGNRITRDLDLAVEEAEIEAARACLLRLGYRDAIGTRGMERPQDVGMLELRHRPSSLSAGYLRWQHQDRPRLEDREGVRARVPSATSRALHWIVHDLIKEGDYWRGRIDLRHLHDLAELARTEPDLDWRRLRDMMPGRLGRNVVETQLRTLHGLFGTNIPTDLRGGGIARLQHQRRMFSARHPVAGAPLRLAGNLAWGVRQLILARRARQHLPAELMRKVLRILAGGAGSKL
ncbi:nucleotidyltransferase family protein [Falsiroseomonas sp. HC035]|uniref:nucleotidyltransferase family protein n=1 Tax=Falsiroseomonas sp. HC035 TaxID=3390999 RepID=UPI003D3222C8